MHETEMFTNTHTKLGLKETRRLILAYHIISEPSLNICFVFLLARSNFMHIVFYIFACLHCQQNVKK